MLAEGKPGIQQNSDGNPWAIRTGRQGDVIVSELHGRYFEQAVRRQLFSASNQAAQAWSAALATTYTGLLLYNPVNSGYNLELLKCKLALTVAPAAIASIGLIAGFSNTGGVTALTTQVTPASTVIGGAPGVAKVLSAATIVTPTWLAQMVDGFTAAALPAPSPISDFEGLFVIPPGGFIGIGALTAVTGLGFLSWGEVPI